MRKCTSCNATEDESEIKRCESCDALYCDDCAPYRIDDAPIDLCIGCCVHDDDLDGIAE